MATACLNRLQPNRTAHLRPHFSLRDANPRLSGKAGVVHFRRHLRTEGLPVRQSDLTSAGLRRFDMLDFSVGGVNNEAEAGICSRQIILHLSSV